VTAVIDANTTLQSPVLRGSIPINLRAGAPVQWTATSSERWLVLTRSTGTTGTALEYVINPDELDLDNAYRQFDWPATVNVTASPVPAAHQLQGQPAAAARAHSRHRALLPGGRAPEPARLRGDGFIANRDWSQHLHVMGVPAGAGKVTRVNDTELVVDLEAGIYGKHRARSHQ
jgi:hypothetical protein